ncbi:MAG: helix-turn-helix transcriptional regulator [Sporolactobacillus sp.]
MEQICFSFASTDEELSDKSSNDNVLLLPILDDVVWVTDNGTHIVNHANICLLNGSCKKLSARTEMDEVLLIRLPANYIDGFLQQGLTCNEDLIWKIDDQLQPIKELMIHEVAMRNDEEAILLLNYLLHKVTRQTGTGSLKFIKKHFTEKIDVRALAEMEHYTPSYYCDWFKRKMRMTPLEYIHYLRIHRAKELLQDSKLSMLSISYQLGYEYNASFTRMFKKYEQISPSEYRAALQSSTLALKEK